VASALSGAVASLGIPIKDAAVLAIEEKGEILGHKLLADAQDDGCAAEPSVTVARRFTADKLVVGVIGSMCSSGTIPASDVYAEAKMVMISPSSTAPNVTGRGLENVFRTAWNDEIQGAGQAKFARDKLGADTAVLIHDKSPYGQGLMEVFRKRFEELGGKVAAFEAIEVGQTDFSALVSKIKPLEPDVIAFGGFIKEGSLLVKQLREAGVEASFLGADGIDDDKFVEGAGKAAEGVYISNGQALKGPGYESFAAKWKEKFGKDPGVFTPQAYDAARVLISALEQVAQKMPDGSLVIGKKALRDAVARTRMEGASGPVAFKPNGDRELAAEVVIKQVENGKRDKIVATLSPFE
jgi:branched-chain amino acid transport system substrate-binding protein